MKPITLPGIEAYAERHTTPDAELLRAVAAATERSCAMPQMLVGPVEGRLLQMLVFALRPWAVLEIGTFTGYSALSMAAVLPPGGRLLTCEIDERHAELARRNIAASPWADRIQVLVGPALATIERLEGPFDFVFLDADKVNYLNYLEAVLPKLARHGLIAADNTLWDGSVLDWTGPDGTGGDGAEVDRDTLALRRFNDVVAADPRLTCVLLTVRDGVTLICRRLPEP
jgi:caffeoyl-CoA O-methyltransferase